MFFIYLISQRNMTIWIFYWYDWPFEEKTRIRWQECVGWCKKSLWFIIFSYFFVFMGGLLAEG